MYIKFLCILILLFNKEPERIFQRHLQSCSAVYTIDRNWQLILSTTGDFSYNIKTINTKALLKETEQQYSGKWLLEKDTLSLLIDNLNDLHETNTALIKFIDRNEKLYPINLKKDTINGIVISLDYLKATTQ